MRGWWVVPVATAAALSGCYDQPKPNCSFSCQTSQLCPDDYQCAPDGLCHLVLAGGTLAECPELLPDASDLDAPVDGPVDGPADAQVDATVDAQVDATVDANVDAQVDASPPDAAPDAMAMIDAPPDASPIDASPPDASPPDAAPAAVDLISCTGVTPDATITTTASAYVPVSTTIAAGDIIFFTPAGMPHDMVSGTGGTPDGAFQTTIGADACLRFNAPGTYPFYCSVHLFTGTVTVN